MNTLLESYTFPQGLRFDLVQGDLTQEPVDAIVNAANEHLMHGGGIAAVISRAGGPTIDQESRAWVREHGPVSHDKPAFTTAGELPQKYVIHAVGPVWGSGDEDHKLAAAIKGSLGLAEELGVESIAFPAISTGIFGFPKERAAKVILQAVHHYFEDQPASKLKTVHMTVYEDSSAATFQQVWQSFHPNS